nr:hypothetical protein CFP56_58046 [Quercus suber]
MTIDLLQVIHMVCRKPVPIADALFEEFGFDFHTFTPTNNTERERGGENKDCFTKCPILFKKIKNKNNRLVEIEFCL